MLFHGVIYNDKELDSQAKHGQSLKKTSRTYDRVFLCQISGCSLFLWCSRVVQVCLFPAFWWKMFYKHKNVSQSFCSFLFILIPQLADDRYTKAAHACDILDLPWHAPGVHTFLWLKMIQIQYLCKYITASVQNYRLTLARFTTVML